MAITTRTGASDAVFKVDTTKSTGSSWVETYNFQVDGGVIHADADDWEWQYNFRKSYDGAVELSLSTTAGTLTVTNGADSTSIAIEVPYSSLSSLEGEYIADMAYEDASGVRVHWMHGTANFRNEPIWS